jgi:Damage-control phosphatase ARMT1-like domain
VTKGQTLVLSEFYLYRRINEAFRYFETGYDMFVQQKAQGLIDAIPAINEIATKLPVILSGANLGDALTIAIQTSLWGNKMDLSLWPAGLRKSDTASATVDTPGAISFGSTLSAGKKFILDDHTSAVVSLLSELHAQGPSSKREIGIIVDNAGYELFSDMLLGHCLLELGAATSIRFFTKGHPTFVSDATNADFMETIDFLASSPSAPTAELAGQFSAHLDGGRFVLDSDLFWCQPTAFWDMPDSIQDKVELCKLVFVKGDANYRRLLGEREWAIDTPASDILSYWPVPVCALRTFKAEIGCGISREKVSEVQAADPTWMVGGRWGVVQIGGKCI